MNYIKIKAKVNEEMNYIGYYNLPENDISHILQLEKKLELSISNIIIVGIGGSSLGSRAIYEFLISKNMAKRELTFIESTDPQNLVNIKNSIDISKSMFIFISKSGTTVETIALLKFFYDRYQSPSNYIFISELGSPLDNFAKDIGSYRFHLDKNVGGRFSVLSTVGLVPLALAGFNIQEILNGAKSIKGDFETNDNFQRNIISKARRFYDERDTIKINCLFSYLESLKSFSEWYVQLWGESLGKVDKLGNSVGLTPIGLIGPKDQHSFLQLITDGPKDKSVTFIKVLNTNSSIIIPEESDVRILDELNGVSFHELLSKQYNSVLQSLKYNKEISVDELQIERIDENSIGGLIYYFELLTSIVGILFEINTYNQPGVELAKIILKEDLEK